MSNGNFNGHEPLRPEETQDLGHINPMQFGRYLKAAKFGLAGPGEASSRAKAAGLNPTRAAYGKGLAKSMARRKGM